MLPQHRSPEKALSGSKALAPEAELEVVGIRPGEKLHEEMISANDARRTVDRGDHFVIIPEIAFEGGEAVEGVPVPAGFQYTSDSNDEWLDEEALRAMVDD